MASGQRDAAEFDASRLIVTLVKELQPVPPADDANFGQNSDRITIGNSPLMIPSRAGLPRRLSRMVL
ncbi:hypothetical protein NUW54_g4669 [Trametes sanguinea]|uniref:Uncharacterized protein n=1 Tax=Trametes sanguinea TaxID=158606 RepID=A0ACC1PXA1_9APHY|nr:hypothetical protein NUW54_g4669 [Trametes sanguinea]